jgi:hypothetical protein
MGVIDTHLPLTALRGRRVDKPLPIIGRILKDSSSMAGAVRPAA